MIFSKKTKDRGVETLRQPDRNPRCYELTDQEKMVVIAKWKSNNIRNPKEISTQKESYA